MREMQKKFPQESVPPPDNEKLKIRRGQPQVAQSFPVEVILPLGGAGDEFLQPLVKLEHPINLLPVFRDLISASFPVLHLGHNPKNTVLLFGFSGSEAARISSTPVIFRSLFRV